MSSTQADAPARTALIVHAHPERDSFSSAQADAAAQALEHAGVSVDRLDLYAEGWNPVLARDQFLEGPGYFKPQAEQMRAVERGTLEGEVSSHLRRLVGADLLVLSFPLWWFSMPAIVKGWVDRVFVMGAAFGGRHGVFHEGALRGKRAVLLLTTRGAEQAFQPGAVDGYGAMDEFLFHIHRGMLEFVGYDVLDPIVTYAPVRLNDDQRSQALRLIQQRFHVISHS